MVHSDLIRVIRRENISRKGRGSNAKPVQVSGEPLEGVSVYFLITLIKYPNTAIIASEHKKMPIFHHISCRQITVSFHVDNYEFGIDNLLWFMYRLDILYIE